MTKSNKVAMIAHVDGSKSTLGQVLKKLQDAGSLPEIIQVNVMEDAGPTDEQFLDVETRLKEPGDPWNAGDRFIADEDIVDPGPTVDMPMVVDGVETTRREDIRMRVLAGCSIDQETGCWVWMGATSGTGRGGGYARMSMDGHTSAVHRVMWANENGYIPGAKQIDHTCENRLCCNPNHLEMVTHKQNQKRKTKRKPDVRRRPGEVPY